MHGHEYIDEAVEMGVCGPREDLTLKGQELFDEIRGWTEAFVGTPQCEEAAQLILELWDAVDGSSYTIDGFAHAAIEAERDWEGRLEFCAVGRESTQRDEALAERLSAMRLEDGRRPWYERYVDRGAITLLVGKEVLLTDCVEGTEAAAWPLFDDDIKLFLIIA